MNSKDHKEITRQAQLVVEYIKMSTVQKVLNAATSGEFSLSRNEIPRLVSLIESSFETGFAKSIKEFETQVAIISKDVSKKNILGRAYGTRY